MSALKKQSNLRHSSSSYDSLYSNPLIDPRNTHSCSEQDTTPDAIPPPLGTHLSLKNTNILLSSKEVLVNPMKKSKKVSSFNDDDDDDKENLVPNNNQIEFSSNKKTPDENSLQDNQGKSLKSLSLQLCIQMNEPDSTFGGFGLNVWDTNEETESAKSVNIWDYSDSEAAPVSSWSTLPNRALMCRTLPMDVGKCTCIIMKEVAPKGFGAGSLYSLYTNEGQGRQNRKLAVAYHKRRSGRSVFMIAQNTKGVLSSSDDSFIGVVTSNLMGSRYYVWNKGSPRRRRPVKESRLLETIIEFTPTIATWTGRHRSLKAWISKQQPQVMQSSSKHQPKIMQSKNPTTQVQNMKSLHIEWEEGKVADQNQIHQLSSRVPYYNKVSKKYELDFREKVRAGHRIQSSVKNFQLTMEGNGAQTILQLGRIGKSKFVLDYRHPLTGYQAFCICLASIDPKLCCTV